MECDIFVPETANHCSDCGCCFDELDHHCVWMSRCVAAKNMRWFIAFNTAWITYVTFIMSSAIFGFGGATG
jgi:DHHC palmitoyltransferase